ncbi:MAG: alpha/beta hydrolase-fold protein [Bacteroidales bacterium]|jgi:enterochelin esterase-like enzyme|nr:alpha/beta hydrolase-fold protein [Bacteroidales bacterium]
MTRPFLLLLLSCFSLSLWAQEGKVIENQILQSEILEYDVPYSVYLPPSYEQSERSYPVIYLLHGYSDKETAWVQFAKVNHTRDRLIAEGKVPPAIIVMPDAKVTWYVNSYDGKDPYMDMFVQEFVPQIEQLYRIRTEQRYRAVSGLSMGGHGALVLTLKYPKTFGTCAAFSAAVYTDDEMIGYLKEGEKGWFHPIFGDLNTDGSLPDHYRDNSVL